MKTAIAIGAHPDDIEFYMAGTLVLLQRVGWEIHYLNVANGCCGSVQYNAKQTRIIRRAEAKRAAGDESAGGVVRAQLNTRSRKRCKSATSSALTECSIGYSCHSTP